MLEYAMAGGLLAIFAPHLLTLLAILGGLVLLLLACATIAGGWIDRFEEHRTAKRVHDAKMAPIYARAAENRRRWAAQDLIDQTRRPWYRRANPAD